MNDTSKYFQIKDCESCGCTITKPTDLFSYGYYIGYHEKWCCRKCYKKLEQEAHNKQLSHFKHFHNNNKPQGKE